jgi:uncharacterized protein YkwD
MQPLTLKKAMLVLVAAFGCGIMPGPFHSVASAEDFPDGGGGMSLAETQFIQSLNAERQKAGLPALVPQEAVMLAARFHALNMADLDVLSHEIDGDRGGERLEQVGYAFIVWRENIASGYRTPAAVVAAWMKSVEGHRKNVLDARVVHIGVGIATSADGRPYYCALFAAPR